MGYMLIYNSPLDGINQPTLCLYPQAKTIPSCCIFLIACVYYFKNDLCLYFLYPGLYLYVSCVLCLCTCLVSVCLCVCVCMYVCAHTQVCDNT
jgi:hypothetical protein